MFFGGNTNLACFLGNSSYQLYGLGLFYEHHGYLLNLFTGIKMQSINAWVSVIVN